MKGWGPGEHASEPWATRRVWGPRLAAAVTTLSSEVFGGASCVLPKRPTSHQATAACRADLGAPPTGRRPEAGASAVSQGLGGASVSGFRLRDHTREVPAACEPFFERLKGLRSPGKSEGNAGGKDATSGTCRFWANSGTRATAGGGPCRPRPRPQCPALARGQHCGRRARPTRLGQRPRSNRKHRGVPNDVTVISGGSHFFLCNYTFL